MYLPREYSIGNSRKYHILGGNSPHFFKIYTANIMRMYETGISRIEGVVMSLVLQNKFSNVNIKVFIVFLSTS